MASKLPKNTFPTGHGPNDFECFGPPAVKDGEFEGTMICDMGCFKQDMVDSNKYYHGSIAQSKLNQKWYPYFEFGRTGATKPSFQFIDCRDRAEAEQEYADQMHAKNDKRGVWQNHSSLGRILTAKPGKDCYLVRPQSTRSTGLPSAKTIKMGGGAVKDSKVRVKVNSPDIDKQTFDLMRDLNIATVSYTKGSMANDALPTAAAISEGRNILNEAMRRIKVVGHNINSQVGDKDLMQLTSMMYSRIPKKKDRRAKPEDWILNQNNVLSWNQDLDAAESALQTVESGMESNPLASLGGIEMVCLSPKTDIGKFIYEWAPLATRNKHSDVGPMRIKNVWSIKRKLEQDVFISEQLKIRSELPRVAIVEKPLHQPNKRPDITNDELPNYVHSNSALLFHATRSVNVTGLLREGFRFPKELTNVAIAGAMFSGGVGAYYTADDWRKSYGYTSFGRYNRANAGIVAGRHAFMFLCDIALGNPHVAPEAYPYITYPKGTHSIFGKHRKTKSGYSNSGLLLNNEFVLLKKSQYRFRYLLEFSAER